MLKLCLIFTTLLVAAIHCRPTEDDVLQAKEELKTSESIISKTRVEQDDEAARNARFNFGYLIQDDINGAVVQRTEERDGLTLKGEYSYSDGFFKRTVAYEADENGYRITKMISEPIGNGPVMNKLGKAVVQMLVSGVETEYAIQAEPVEDEDQEELRNIEAKLEEQESVPESV